MHTRLAQFGAVLLMVTLLGASCTSSAADAGAGFFSDMQLRVAGFMRVAQESATNAFNSAAHNAVQRLADEQKQAVDEWLIRNDLNEFGDPKNTVYTGGTPLFNEDTGETINRFQYLFDKFPQLQELLNKGLLIATSTKSE